MPGEFQGRTRPDSSASTTSTFLRRISQNRAHGAGSRLMSSQNVALIEVGRRCLRRTPARSLTSQRVARTCRERGHAAPADCPPVGKFCLNGVHFAARELASVASAIETQPWTSPRRGARR